MDLASPGNSEPGSPVEAAKDAGQAQKNPFALLDSSSGIMTEAAVSKNKLMRAGRKAAHTFELVHAGETQNFRDGIDQFLTTPPDRRTEDMIAQFVKQVVSKGKYKFFQAYTDSQHRQLARVAMRKQALKDDVLFRQDDAPDALYLVIGGRVSLFKTQGEARKLLSVAGGGDAVGDLLHLDERNKRSCTAQVTTDEADLMFFRRADLDVLAHEWRTSEDTAKAEFVASSVPVLNSVPRESLAALSTHFERVRFAKDTVIYRQQDDATAIYFIWEGQVQLIKRIDLIKVAKKAGGGGKGGTFDTRNGASRGGERESSNAFDIPSGPKRISKSIQVGILSPGEYFGEVEVLNESTRSSATIAMSNVTLLALNKHSIEAMPPAFLDALYRYSYQRVQWRNSRISLLFDCLNNINWVPERDPKLTMEPEIKTHPKMKTAQLPLATQPGSDRKGWLGAHTVMTEDDAREWGMYSYGAWARPPDKEAHSKLDGAAAGGGGGTPKSRSQREGASFFQVSAGKEQQQAAGNIDKRVRA